MNAHSDLAAYHAHLHQIARDYDRADPAFAARMREHAAALVTQTLEIPPMPVERVGLRLVASR